MAYMYKVGEGVPLDYATAVSWYRKAAEQGYDIAQINLGSMYEQGQGVPQDYIQAHMWFNLAAARNAFNTNRDRIAAKMMPAQIAEAPRRPMSPVGRAL